MKLLYSPVLQETYFQCLYSWRDVLKAEITHELYKKFIPKELRSLANNYIWTYENSLQLADFYDRKDPKVPAPIEKFLNEKFPGKRIVREDIAYNLQDKPLLWRVHRVDNLITVFLKYISEDSDYFVIKNSINSVLFYIAMKLYEGKNPGDVVMHDVLHNTWFPKWVFLKDIPYKIPPQDMILFIKKDDEEIRKKEYGKRFFQELNFN